MIALLLTALFTAAALLAGGTLVHGLRGVVGDAAQARAALAACPKTVFVDYRVSEVRVPRGPARVLVLPIRPKVRRLAQPQLLAAA